MAVADVGLELRDAAARVDYGYLTGDLAIVLAARDALGRQGGDAWRDYTRAYAAYRAASLAIDRGERAAPLLDDCAQAAEAAGRNAALRAEALVLAGACAALSSRIEPLRAVLHLRRSRLSLLEAARLDPANPRLGLVAARFPDAAEGILLPRLEAMVESYGGAGIDEFPDWGEVEALMLLGARRMESGDLRSARDALEQALLIAPDYAAALELRERISRLAAAD